jgi:hypothetical protein
VERPLHFDDVNKTTINPDETKTAVDGEQAPIVDDQPPLMEMDRGAVLASTTTTKTVEPDGSTEVTSKVVNPDRSTTITGTKTVVSAQTADALPEAFVRPPPTAPQYHPTPSAPSETAALLDDVKKMTITPDETKTVEIHGEGQE